MSIRGLGKSKTILQQLPADLQRPERAVVHLCQSCSAKQPLGPETCARESATSHLPATESAKRTALGLLETRMSCLWHWVGSARSCRNISRAMQAHTRRPRSGACEGNLLHPRCAECGAVCLVAQPEKPTPGGRDSCDPRAL